MKQKKKCKQIATLKIIFLSYVFFCPIFSGCDSLRFAPNEAQKQNAWLHNRTVLLAAETARAQDTSKELQALTQLGEVQSRAFSSYFGLPKEFPQAETVEDILAESNLQLAHTALLAGADRPDPWQVADSMLELGIGVCALFGGFYGTKAVRFLKEARTKSKALQEIVAGNELFKKQSESSSAAFKKAHSRQSPQTRQIVAQLKA